MVGDQPRPPPPPRADGLSTRLRGGPRCICIQRKTKPLLITSTKICCVLYVPHWTKQQFCLNLLSDHVETRSSLLNSVVVATTKF